MTKRINRISVNDTIKAVATDKNGKFLASVYDSQFSSIDGVIGALNQKAGGWCKPIHEVSIHNLDKDWIGYYTVNGKKK